MDIPRLTGRLASCARTGRPGADNTNMAVKDVLWLNSLNPGTPISDARILLKYGARDHD